MADELVNQLTLNFLISKNQLQKLNRKNKEINDNNRLKELQYYNDRIQKLFQDLLVCNPPEDLLYDVKSSFDAFIEKSIYYLKTHDTNIQLEQERDSSIKQDIIDDIDFDKEEREIEQGNYEELSDISDPDAIFDEELNNAHDFDADNDIIIDSNDNYNSTNKVKKNSYLKKDNNQKLPLDWFNNVRQKYQKNQIIPRKKEPTIVETTLFDIKKKI
jgi:hypothetical protein